ncbi:MAG: T9SS type A sorting domain-containing protein [Aequorivita sp.]|nr:T9SS type A sorting domain-containing protein [Aequorivita sp.]MCB0468721.1 T9SS type A sorting domain-containing protein [Aequorivita sp.]
MSIEIVDVNGKKLFAQTDLKQNNSISLPNLSEGIYFVNLLKKGKIVSIKKLIKG